jgi:hypothetical protein
MSALVCLTESESRIYEVHVDSVLYSQGGNYREAVKDYHSASKRLIQQGFCEVDNCEVDK